MTPTPQPEIDPTSAAQRVRDGEALLVDVREDDEWAAGHAPHAVHHALGGLDPAALPTGRTVIAVCRSGARSSRAVAALTAAGVYAANLTGGMQAWQAAGLPVVTADESPGRVI